MIKTNKLPFDEHVAEYDAWFEKYAFVFQSEVAAIKQLLPKGDVKGIEVGVGTGQFATALGIKEGLEPSNKMRMAAAQKGVFTFKATAEENPYKSNLFDYVLMNFCVSHFHNVQKAFAEAHRILKNKGVLIVGFIDKNSHLGKIYEQRKHKSIFYKKARFYAVEDIEKSLLKAGFKSFEFYQTLFHNLGDTKTIEAMKPGFGEGSYVFIKATK